MLKNYIQILDVLVVLFLGLAIHYFLNAEVTMYIAKNAKGTDRSFEFSWQSLMVISTGCLALRHFASKLERQGETNS